MHAGDMVGSIGEAVARALSEVGHEVIATRRNIEKAVV